MLFRSGGRLPVTIGPNDVLRFCLEMAALFALAWWGFGVSDDWPARLTFGLGAPLLGAAAWGTFRVPNDPKPDPPVEVPGLVRLMIEFGFFAAATVALWFGVEPVVAVAFAAVVLAHYAAAYRRVLWLVRDRGTRAGGITER